VAECPNPEKWVGVFAASQKIFCFPFCSAHTTLDAKTHFFADPIGICKNARLCRDQFFPNRQKMMYMPNPPLAVAYANTDVVVCAIVGDYFFAIPRKYEMPFAL